MVRAVFFDWFNTLARYDPPREVLHSQLLGEFGVNISPAQLLPGLFAADKFLFAKISHQPLSKRNPEEQAELYAQYTDIMVAKAGVKLEKKLIFQIIGQWPRAILSQIHFVLFDDVLSTLKTLKERQLVLGLLTNASKDTIAILPKLGLEPYLDFVVTSEEAKADKPNPKIFQLALERAKATAAETVHVGDQYEIDVAGARGAGIKPIMIDRYNLYPEVTDCPRIHSLSELNQYI